VNTPRPSYLRIRCKHCGEFGALFLSLDEPIAISPNFFIGRPKRDPHNPLAITFACVRCRKGVTIDRVIKEPKELKWAQHVIAGEP
jgi:hypothetical protein